ncbi:MAG: hypothetical protein ACJAUR_000259 [Ulvibacter sp.]|jgi:hypothetical protein
MKRFNLIASHKLYLKVGQRKTTRQVKNFKLEEIRNAI